MESEQGWSTPEPSQNSHYPALNRRTLGWLRFLWEKATTPDDWSSNGVPHPWWDRYTSPVVLSYGRFNLAYSTCLTVTAFTALFSNAMVASAEPQTATTATVEVGAARIETMTWGDGEPVILLPGSGYSAIAFGLLGPELARRGYRAIAVSPRGVRGSTGPLENLTFHDYAADVATLIDRVAGGRAHVLGWAWGNRIARTLAVDAPGRVASITLIAAGGKFPSDPSVAALTEQLRQPGLSPEDRNRLLALRSLAPASDVGPLLAITESWPTATTAAWNAAGRATRLDEWWPGGSAPMLVLQGLQDKIAPPGNGRDLKASYPERVTLVEIDGAGHAALVEHPARLADEAVRFLRQHPVRGSR